MPAKIVPCLRCADAPAAIAWLCEACGFERRLVVPDGNGGTAHAELTLGDGMIMLGSRGDGEYDGLQALLEGAGTVTQAPYIVVADVDAHCARARAARAEIVMEPKEQHYTCRDPEGHLWNFGSYDPWAA